jgi:hypothetical protein
MWSARFFRPKVEVGCGDEQVWKFALLHSPLTKSCLHSCYFRDLCILMVFSSM